ncbi:MAG: alginate export family protein [Novosphingobium sp. 28-62-57]|uniref:alginate export family protein n=1 Tax=unclassified Novosphingobium TaxID=2644732 RepID=UPI000BD2DD36|nr:MULTISPECIES: alginate export family protein [unclassified Novosphingobium]OYW50347.1 MAG: alginate export family protein [Novosphingobium sp. 12-62-10]OYZ11550.1 MAG: alginate export family protein [Novosphingobium sp. 28-62-57]HQS70407.1 alginate export family protein [Novosphingobium sp.]
MRPLAALSLLQLALWPTVAVADEATGPFTIAASARLRLESIDGQFRPAPTPENDTMVSLRTEIAASYDAGAVRFNAELWDARAWGQDARSSANTREINAFELVQANVQVPLAGKSILTLGRYTLDLGNRRMVARQRFSNTTNAFTGAHLALEGEAGRKLDLLFALPHQRLPDDTGGILADRVQWDRENFDVVFFGAHGTLPGIAHGTLQPYAFALIERDGARLATTNRRIGTLGARHYAKAAAGKWDHDLEGAVQFGKARRTSAPTDSADLDVFAWFIHAEVGYTLTGGWTPRIAVLFDAASGDGGKPDRFTRFDTLYSARRFEFGPNGLYGPFRRSNIVSPSARLEVTPSKHTDAFIAWRSAWAENSRDQFASTGVPDASGVSGSLSAHQIEGRIRHWIMPGLLQVDAGAALLLKRRLLRDAPNAPASGNTRYGYIDLTLAL